MEDSMITDDVWEAPVDKKQLFKKYGVITALALLIILLITAGAMGIHYFANGGSNNYPPTIIKEGVTSAAFHPNENTKITGTINFNGGKGSIVAYLNKDMASGTITQSGETYHFSTLANGMMVKTSVKGWTKLRIDTPYTGWVYIPGTSGYELLGLTSSQLLGNSGNISMKKNELVWGKTIISFDGDKINAITNGKLDVHYADTRIAPTPVKRGKATMVKKNGVNTIEGVSPVKHSSKKAKK